MSYRTLVHSSLAEYLACNDGSPEDQAIEKAERDERIARFPFTVMLQVSYPEYDFINRWCWLNFGPCNGDCWQQLSEYRVCHVDSPHSHDGKWTVHFFLKTQYNFGYSEWYFAQRAGNDLFLEHLDKFHWGEKYPK